MMSVERTPCHGDLVRRFVFCLSTLVVAAFVTFLVVPSVHAAKAAPDKSGLDILCKCEGCEYHGPTTKVHYSQCIYPDGQVITCSNKTDKCSSTLTAADEGKSNTQGTTVEDAVTLRSLKLLNDSMNKLMSEMASVSFTLKAVEADIRQLKPAQ
jgi:hypothetical protein